jgi:DNA (cytosine-5)-methyltransferase 1
MLTIGSLFSGIGGLELGLERAGLGPVLWQAERAPVCRAVLAKHWPHARRYEDVREVESSAARVAILCGGFPCQPVSLAGRRRAQADERWLWPEFARVIDEIAPAVVVAENVLGLRTAGLRDVLADLAALGFDAEWSDLGAVEIGAPHRRRRIFLVAAHPNRVAVRLEPGWLGRACGAAARVARDSRDQGAAPDADALRELQPSGRESAQWRRARNGGWWPPVHPLRGMDDGLPDRLDRHRSGAIAALGNAVVPQVSEVIGRALLRAGLPVSEPV